MSTVLVSTSEYTIEAYSEKAIAVFVATQHIAKYEPILTGLGSSANYALKGANGQQKRTGYVFPKGKLDAVSQALSSGVTPATPVVGVKKSVGSGNSGVTEDKYEKLAQEFATLQKLVYNLTARLEAVEAEQQAARKVIGTTPQESKGVKTKRPASAGPVRPAQDSVYDMPEAYDDISEGEEDMQDEPAPKAPFKSLIIRKPAK